MAEIKKPTKSVNELVQDILVDTREQINSLLTNSNDVLRINFVTKFDQMINHIGFINGQAAGATAVTARKRTLQPLTDFMGDKVEPPTKKITSAKQLTPDEERKQQFKKDVEDLTAAFHDLSNEQILDSYKNKSVIIRGVARNAGLEKFRPDEVDINDTFLNDIRTALGAKVDFDQNKIKISKDFENMDQQ